MSLHLEFQNVNFNRGSQQILKNFSCQISQGSLVSVLGASGSGKTTLLRLAAGLEKPESGNIILRGQKVAGEGLWVSPGDRQLGFVFQNFALFEKVSVEKNIFYGCKEKAHLDEANRIIQLMGLEKHLSKKPYQLSGGERQRVALARSLSLLPDLILLDEPFSSIDPKQTVFLIQELKSLFESLKITAMMVTHSEDEAKEFSSSFLRL